MITLHAFVHRETVSLTVYDILVKTRKILNIREERTAMVAEHNQVATNREDVSDNPILLPVGNGAPGAEQLVWWIGYAH